jgi:hypothetical protein
MYGVKATWNYFEAGHGKGPCDGLGGLTKRLADEAVNMGKTTIQDAYEFFAWTQSSDCSMKIVEFVFVSGEECQKKTEEIGRTVVKPIQGTMKLHAVVGGKEPGVVHVADVSCYCVHCRTGELCSHWKSAQLIRSDRTPNETEITPSEPEHVTQHQTEITSQDKSSNVQENLKLVNNDDKTIPNEDDSTEEDQIIKEQYKEGDFVAALYSNRWYIGEVADIDDGEIEINFMKSNKCNTFQWPAGEDKIWLNPKDILSKVKKPRATGRSQRAFKLEDDDIELINTLFAARKQSQ